MNADMRSRLTGQRLACVLLGALAFFVTHKFTVTVGRAPALAFDDALAGISANLAREGRLGFDAVPVNPLALVSQNENFFNYGPWYFFFAASLDWLFGTSYEVHRWAHLLGVLLSIGLASMFFKERDRLYATSIYGCGALLSFHYHQWPMARPDIIGTLGASLALVLAGIVFKGGGRWHLFGFGLSVGIAVTNHPIVAALVPWSFGVLFAALRVRGQGRGWRAFRELAVPWAAGLMASGVALAFASGFRLGAILELYFVYPIFVGKVGPTIGFMESIGQHLSLIGLPLGTAQVAATVLLSLVLADLLAFVRRPTAGSAITLLPGSAWAAYLLSLGVFRNTHEGYTILLQLLFLWTTTSLVVRMGPFAAQLAGLSIPVASLLLVSSTPGRWEQQAMVNVPYREYIDAVRADIPMSAYVQGEAILGLGRPNWVDMAYADLLARDTLPRFRGRLVPDFLVISEKEWDLECLQAQSTAAPRLFAPGQPQVQGGFFNQIPWLFRNGSFRLLRIVSAQPYRATRIYLRVDSGTTSPPRPEVAVWSPRDLWQRGVTDLGLPFTRARALALQLKRPGAPRALETRADQAWEANLGAGSYLVEVVGAAPAKAAGCVVATSAEVVRERSDVRAAAPRFPRGRTTHLVVNHEGGLLRVALLSPGPAEEEAVVSVTAFKITPSLPPTAPRDAGGTYPKALLRCRDNPGREECGPAGH